MNRIVSRDWRHGVNQSATRIRPDFRIMPAYSVVQQQNAGLKTRSIVLAWGICSPQNKFPRGNPCHSATGSRNSLMLRLHDEFQPGTHIKAIARLHDNPSWNLNPGLEPGLKKSWKMRDIVNSSTQVEKIRRVLCRILFQKIIQVHVIGKRLILRAWFQPASCKHMTNLNPAVM